MSEQYKITVNTDGNYKIETIGFTGPRCVADSQHLKDELGVEVEDDREYKLEHDLPQTVEVQQSQSVSI